MEAARLRDELKALAVEGERERIACEMHDGLAQVLGYVNTKSQAVDTLLDDPLASPDEEERSAALHQMVQSPTPTLSVPN